MFAFQYANAAFTPDTPALGSPKPALTLMLPLSPAPGSLVGNGQLFNALFFGLALVVSAEKARVGSH